MLKPESLPPPRGPEDELAQYNNQPNILIGSGKRAESNNRFHRETVIFAHEYMQSHPGPGSRTPNQSITSSCVQLLQYGTRPSAVELQRIWHQLDYRFNVFTKAATDYKNLLGANFPDCDQIEPKCYPLTSEQIGKLEEIKRLLWSYALFDPPNQSQGTLWVKGEDYLAACLTVQGWGKATCIAKLDALVKNRSEF